METTLNHPTARWANSVLFSRHTLDSHSQVVRPALLSW